MKTYLLEVILVSKPLSNILFIVYCLTSAPLGILIGGIIVQKNGGYSSIFCLYFLVFNCSMVLCLSITTYFVVNVVAFSIIMWLLLFFGSSIVPNIAGSLLSSLPIELKGSGYSVQNLMVNSIGNAPAPYLFGVIYEHTKYTAPTLALGISLSFSIFGLISLIVALKIKKQQI